jgi:transposase
MVSIHKVKNREGVVYVRMYEGWRENGKNKTSVVKNFGRLEDLAKNGWGSFEELRTKAANGEIEYISKRNQIIKKIDLNESIDEYNPINYGWMLLNGVYEKLGLKDVLDEYCSKHNFKYDLDKILKLLVFSRVLNPQSKKKTYEYQKELYGEWNFSKNDIYRSLDHLYNLVSDIQLKTHQTITCEYGRIGTLVFYDITNYFFTIDINDEYALDKDGNLIKGNYRRKGASKEHRPEQIVQLGLFMDSKGIPISFKIFPGNIGDPKTYVPAIKQVKKQFGLEKIVTVADKAMNSITNVSEAKLNGDGYLFSSKVRGDSGVAKDIQNFALGETGWSWNSNMTLAIKSMIHSRVLTNGQKIREKVVVVWSEKYAKRQKIRREGALNHAQTLTNAERYRASCKTGAKKFIELYEVDSKTGDKRKIHPFLGIDWKTVDKDEKYDGLNVILTSEIYMLDDEILKNYHNLSKIEDCFRVTKSDLKARPVFVWTSKHIYAHFLTCFLALQVVRIFQMKTHRKFSAKKIQSALNSAIAKNIEGDYYDVSASKDFCTMAKKLGIDWSKRNIHRCKFENLKR